MIAQRLNRLGGSGLEGWQEKVLDQKRRVGGMGGYINKVSPSFSLLYFSSAY